MKAKEKYQCGECGEIFTETLEKGEKMVKYPHAIMIDSKKELHIIICNDCRSENIEELKSN